MAPCPHVARSAQPARVRVRPASLRVRSKVPRTVRAVPSRLNVSQDRPGSPLSFGDARLQPPACWTRPLRRRQDTIRGGSAAGRLSNPLPSGLVRYVVPNMVFQNSNLETPHMPPGQTWKDAPLMRLPRLERAAARGPDRRARRSTEGRPRIATLERRSAA